MKRLTALLLAAVMVMSMAACGNNAAQTKATENKETQAPATASETKATQAQDTEATTAAADETQETKANAPETQETKANEPEALGYEKLIIGVDDTFAPMGFLDENNELVGFDIDMAKAVGEKLGIEVEFQVVNWDMKEQELNQGNIDLIWNGYSITDERKEKVNFSNAYLDNDQVVVTMAESGIASLADLAGKTVAAQTDSSAVEAMDANPDISSTFGDRPTFDTNDMAIMDMEAGRSDAVVADKVLLDYVISHKDDPSKYVILEEGLGAEEYAVGVRKEDTALLEALNNALAELKADGTAAEISTKWFGSDIVK